MKQCPLFSAVFLFTLLSMISSVKITSLKRREKIYNPSLALHRLKERIIYLNDTSCKVAAKFILLTICNISDKAELPVLKLTSDYQVNLALIREKLMEGDVLQIEIRANHHFIIFKKNDRELYLLQAFQDRFKLKDWIANEEVMKPYLTINAFFDKMEMLLNPKTPRNIIEEKLIELFLPPFFSSDPVLIGRTLSYFRGMPVSLVNVNYVNFDFSMKYKGNDFDAYFNYVVKHYNIGFK